MQDELIREAKLFEAGEYPDKGLTVTESDLDAMVSAFTTAVPVRVQHGESPWDGKMGRVVEIWREGKELMGKIAWPSSVWAFLCAMGTKKLSVGLNKLKQLVEVSVVDVPRVLTAQAFGDSMPLDAVVLFTNDFESDGKGGVVFMTEFSAEVQSAIKAAEDRGVLKGTADAKTQFDAQLSPLAKENAELRRSKSEDAASVILAGWKSEGKLPPACDKFAQAILIDGAGPEVTFSDGGHMTVKEAFLQFMTNMPRVVNMEGKTDEGKTDEEFTEADAKMAAELGVTKDEWLLVNGRKAGK